MPLNLTHLAAFHAVATEKSFSRAADRILVSQPALSKQVRLLERAVKLDLFTRTPRGVLLTAAGQLLADYAARLFHLRDDAEHALLELRGLRRGRLAIGASTTIGVHLLPPLLVSFRRAYPQIDVHLEIANTTDVQHRLLNHTLDLGLTEGDVADDRLDVSVFRHDHLVPIAHPKHPLLRKRRLTIAQLVAEPFIVRETGSGTKSVIERALASAGHSITPMLSLANTEAIKRAVAAGLGVAIVSRLAIDTELAAKRLAILNVPSLDIRRPLHRLLVRNAPRSPAADAFLHLLSRGAATRL